MLLMLAGLAHATDAKACVRGDTHACDRMRTRAALRWARGTMGWGPQEEWRYDEMLVLRGDVSSRWRCWNGDDEACREHLPDRGACLFDGDCHDAFERPDPPEQPAWTNDADAPVSVVVTVPVRVEDPPEAREYWKHRFKSSSDPYIWLYVVEQGPVLWTGVVPPGEGLPDGLPEGVEVHLPLGDRCGARQILHPDGRPAVGVPVFATQGGVHLTDEYGLVTVCGAPAVAVDGDSAAVLRDSAIGKPSTEVQWQLTLEPGQRARCRLNDAEPVYCDALPVAAPLDETRFVEQDAEGVFVLTRQEQTWRAAQRNPWVTHFAHEPADRAHSPIGAVCLVDRVWERCTDSWFLKVRDIEGQPTHVRFKEGFGDVDGRLEVPPGTRELNPMVPMHVRIKGKKVIALPSRDAIDPRPLPSDWDQVDFDALTATVIEQLPLPWGVERDQLEVAPFVGGAYVSVRGMTSIVAFADVNTAVIRGPVLEHGFGIIQLEKP